MKPRAVTDPVDALSATLVDLNARTRALEVVSHRHIDTYGSFLDTTDQIAAAINTPRVITFNTTDLSYGIAVVSSSRITIDTPGVYSLTFSLQLHNNGGGGTNTDFWVWLRRNGSNVANSNSYAHVSNNTYLILCVNFFIEATAPGDFFELVFEVGNTAIRIENLPAVGSRPAVPSVICTVGRVPGRQ